MNVYDSVIKGTQASRLILIEDSFLAKGQFLLHLISTNRKSYDIHVLCYENLVSKYQTLFPSLSNIQYHDCMTNILSLNFLSMYETVSSIIEKSTRNIVIFIDSLSMYLLRTAFSKVYKELLDITSSDKFPSIVQCVAVIHNDVTEVNQIEHLKNICKTHIQIQSTNNPLFLKLRLEHKRSNGKYIVQKLRGELKSDCSFKLINDLAPQKIEEDKGIPTNLASFKLDLQDNEKKAKEELILPYTLVQNTSNTGGMIHYVPDEADDWDEEDPDDDLEI